MTRSLPVPTIDAVVHLDRSSHHRTDRAWLSDRWRAPDTCRFLLIDLKPVITEAPTGSVLQQISIEQVDALGLNGDAEQPIFLGLAASGCAWFALSVSSHAIAHQPGGSALIAAAADLRRLASDGVLDSEALSLAGQARALAEWHRTNRCCGRCGGRMTATDGGWRRHCWACGREQFPRTDPVVIMLPVCGDRCLMARGAHFPPSVYSALAGFLEPGEDVERAVRREVKEEVGLEVGAVIYQESQPWPFPHSLMIGCRADVSHDQLTIDANEIAEAFWVDRVEARLMLAGTHPLGRLAPGRHAIARELLIAFVDDRPMRSIGR
jgi:NAD+ diphosphatase